MSEAVRIDGVEIVDEFAEAFDMKATRLIITGHDSYWAHQAASTMTGFGTSVIACGAETAIEQELSPEDTPDGRPGYSVLMFAVSGSELEKQITRRVGQCVLTCATAAIFAGVPETDPPSKKRLGLGKAIRFFGDGYQVSKKLHRSDGTSTRYWRVPVMDGEFIIEHDVARIDGIGGGNFILLAETIDAALLGCRAAIDAMAKLPEVITPFPGGVARSGSKVGSKYPKLFASTNDAYCPTLRDVVDSCLRDDENAVLEIVIDGLNFEAIAESMRVGILAACQAAGDRGLRRITAGNYGGKLGRHHFRLVELF
ncbi:MAG: formylmethanofuran--tetrahydromethanopterin N-formyltransferase [Planctomycetota bacterium]